MKLQALDIAIIIAYIILTLLIGFWISRQASKSTQHYFLGGNQIPWYMLGLSNASGMFDISGTMWMVGLLFIYGLKSVYIPWLWPAFNQIFLMIFLSAWLRRSGVTTGAEWIKFRFGSGPGANLSHIIVIVFALINVIGFLAYGFIGIGKFAAIFLPWELSPEPYWNEVYYGLIITALTTVYVVKGGMFSVVFTEVLQFIIMTIASVAVGLIAMQQVSPEMLDQYIPEGWRSLSFGWELGLDWTGIMESANQKISEDGWELFTIFFMLLLFKGVLQSLAGPAPNYDMQRILSARTPKEALMMSGLVSLVLYFPRYMFIAGLTVLALVFFSEELNSMESVDFELVLPFAMANFIPTGLLGLLIAGLLAAFMSTFAATTNAAPAYVVNDIYKRYINADRSEDFYVRMSYGVAIGVVLIGTFIGLFVTSLNAIVQWITAALWGGYTAANVLKWFWWRFNGHGYFWGMMAGMAGAVAIPAFFPEIAPLNAFPAILLVSGAGSYFGSIYTPTDDLEVLKNFYRKTRPWGFWKPVVQAIQKEDPGFQPNPHFGRDMLNVAVGIVWQTALAAGGIFLVIQDYQQLWWCLGVIVLTSIFLKINWYDKIEGEEAY
ncbi:sodium:solute symporter family protein [Phaeodactylibacter xiamenensis]|uniref:sodium:solute symporter family protein n=1 Tax=Phaeodactylibacter xiamenensis TaxID=1524460 RepID=UPI0024A9A1A5|nr:sodium:solute symporter family protein [Phaeodactylibacter xiamenensis]